MITISAQDLQRQVGEVQMQAARAPVLITSHGKPRCVILSVEEFERLKSAAGEPVPSEVRRKGLKYRPRADPLGYDLGDMDAAMLAMADDAIAGRGKEAVEADLASVRRRMRLAR